MLALTLSALSLLAPVQRALAPQAVAAGRADVCMSFSQLTHRRAFLAGAAAAVVSAAPAFADDDTYKLKKDYVVDAKNMLNNMKTATELQRGNPDMVRVAFVKAAAPQDESVWPSGRRPSMLSCWGETLPGEWERTLSPLTLLILSGEDCESDSF